MQLLRQSVRRGLGALTLLGALAACDSTEPSNPTSVVAVGSAALTGRAGQAASTPLVVQVLNQNGKTLSGQTVTFAVTAGGGTVTPTTATTDADGKATAAWTFGRTVGVQSVTATVGTLAPVQFLATVTAGAPAAVAISAGNAQTTAVGTTVATRPAVVVRDAGGNPVAGVDVVFTVSQGNGTVTGGTATTDANGVATVGSWQLGTTAGANQLTATALGSGITGNPIVFTATGTAGTAARIEAQPLASATGIAGVAVATANLPTVVIRDVNGNPVSGATVTFSVVSGGGTISGATQTTNANGVATVGGLTLGATAGPNTIAATGSGVGQVTFAITGTAGAPFSASPVATTNNLRAPAGTPLTIGPSVLVVDRFGNPVAGVQVTFSVGSGGGSVIGPTGGPAQTATATTNANGVATVSGFTLGATPGTNSLIARVAGLTDVTLTATGLPGAPAKLTKISGDSATVLAFNTVPLVVEVRDAAGNVVPDTTVTFTVSGGASGTVTSSARTNASGRATATFTANSTVGVSEVTAAVNGLSVKFVITTAQNTPARAEIVQGNNQTATAGAPVPVVPIIRVLDAAGRPVQGVLVRFIPFAAVDPSTVQFDTVRTDSAGRANPGTWTLSPDPGQNQLSVLPAGVVPVVFSATGVALPPGLQITAQANTQDQTAPAGTVVPVAPAVVVRDASGNPVAGVTVAFQITAGGGTLNVPGKTGPLVYAVTNTAGVASVTSWVLGSDAATQNTVLASVVGGGPVVQFRAATQ